MHKKECVNIAHFNCLLAKAFKEPRLALHKLSWIDNQLKSGQKMVSAALHGRLLSPVVVYMFIEDIEKGISSGDDTKVCQDRGKLKNG